MTRPLPWVYGAIPKPNGGVATFVLRLARQYSKHIAGVLDPYYGDDKRGVGVTHHYPSSSGVLGSTRVRTRLIGLRHHPVLINGSTIDSLLMLAPFLVGRTKPTALILHHGNLEFSRFPPLYRNWIFPKLASVFSIIACLNDTQYKFYRSLGFPESRLSRMEAYIPMDSAASNHQPSQPAREILTWIDQHVSSPVVISSGYAEPYYHYEWALDAMRDASFNVAIRYLICTYGPPTDYLADLNRQVSTVSGARLIHGLGEEDFNYLMAKCQIYVRPTDIDSFGIAARDALDLGLTVIASNVATRDRRTWTHRAGDETTFRQLLARAAKGSLNRDEMPEPSMIRESSMTVAKLLERLCNET